MKNYFTIEQFSLLYDHYAFVDVPEHYADQLFIKHKVTVEFGHEYRHPDDPMSLFSAKHASATGIGSLQRHPSSLTK